MEDGSRIRSELRKLASAEHSAREFAEAERYDFHFSFGGHTHHAALAVSELPTCLTWLCAILRPQKTDQVYEQSADESPKPPFRVRIYNR